MSYLLDPATLTPESLYKLQSETWAQGAEYERDRIWKYIEELYKNSESTRTPIYQDRMYNYLKNIMWPQHPPEQFRDKSNGE